LRGAANATNIIILTAVLSCLNSALYVSSRTLFQLAARDDAPGWLIVLNARRTPARAITFSTLIGSAGVVLAVVSPSYAFAFLVNASGAIVLGVYLSVCVAYLKIRNSTAASDVWRLAPYPAIVYVTAWGLLLVLTEMAASKDMASQLYASLVPFGLALAAYGLMRRRRRTASTANMVNS